jgi:hypothetical protein
MVMTVNATAMFNVLPVPMYTLKITADKIYGKKYNEVTMI